MITFKLNHDLKKKNLSNILLLSTKSSPYSGSGRTGVKPIATRVILSREDLTKKLAELSSQQNRIKDREDNIAEKIDLLADQQKDDSEFLKDLLMSLMTTTENREVFGRNRK